MFIALLLKTLQLQRSDMPELQILAALKEADHLILYPGDHGQRVLLIKI
jgi:hypothetical protein